MRAFSTPADRFTDPAAREEFEEARVNGQIAGDYINMRNPAEAERFMGLMRAHLERAFSLEAKARVSLRKAEILQAAE